MLQDIAILTGAQVISKDLDMELKDATLEMLGHVSQAVIDKENTILVGGAGKKEDIEDRIQEIKNQIAVSTSDFDKEKMHERIGKLSGGVAVIHVGAATEVEMKEKKLRIEDALSATKAAVEEGIVAGGGTALINAIPAIEKLVPTLKGDEKTGAKSFCVHWKHRSVRLQQMLVWKAALSSTRFGEAARLVMALMLTPKLTAIC